VNMDRRRVFQAAFAVLLSLQAGAAEQTTGAGQLFEQDLPDLSLDGWSVTAVEVRYEGGGTSKPHRHPGFVLGYVLEGDIEFQLAGQAKTVCRAGQMFYEPPGSIHQVSANASATKPARMLAMVFAKKGVPRSMPA
jgi:quercetin dioxygenase-like cupin family protein